MRPRPLPLAREMGSFYLQGSNCDSRRAYFPSEMMKLTSFCRDFSKASWVPGFFSILRLLEQSLDPLLDPASLRRVAMKLNNKLERKRTAQGEYTETPRSACVACIVLSPGID